MPKRVLTLTPATMPPGIAAVFEHLAECLSHHVAIDEPLCVAFDEFVAGFEYLRVTPETVMAVLPSARNASGVPDDRKVIFAGCVPAEERESDPSVAMSALRRRRGWTVP